MAVATLAGAPPAGAATVGTMTEEGVSYVVFSADDGVDDLVMVSRPTTGNGFDSSRIQFYNRYGGIRVRGECQTVGDPENTTTVDCPNKDAILIVLGDGTDETEVGPEIGQMPVLTIGGPGDDVLTGGPGADVLVGEAGNDRLLSSAGDNQLSGGSGADLLVSGPGNEKLDGGEDDDTIEEGAGGGGADEMIGGDGIDKLLFDEHGPVAVSLDDQPGDGAQGENDNAHADIENVEVDAPGSVVVGSAAPNVLRSSGRGARTVLDGAAGNDVLRGDVGPEQLIGGEGDDELIGGLGDDELDGGPGSDKFVADDVDASFGTGADVIRADDGIAENISCGPGPDTANLDAGDIVSADNGNICEVVNRSGKPKVPVPVKDTTPPALTVAQPARARLAKLLRSGAAIGVACSEACTATVRLRLSKRVAKRLGVPTVLGAAEASVSPEGRRTVRVRLSRRARRRLRRVRTLTLQVVVSARDAAGNTSSAKRALKVTR